MSQKTWGGRFSGDTDNRVEAFTESISFDRRLYRHDIRASQAHARMLAEVGLLTADEAEQIVAALDAIAAEIERGEFAFSIKLEDIHTHIERALIERLGDVGRKLHTGRSRNDQVVTDVKLWVRDAIDDLDGRLARVAARPARRRPSATATWCCPATRTCSGRSRCWRPITSSPTSRSTSATATAWPTAASASTSCRSAPPPWPARRCRSTARASAGKLGFDAVAANSLDVSSDRDFVLEFVFDLSVIALHLSGWAEEWVLWTTTEFGFLDLPDAFCTGSSIMPHKKNPDVLELIRGKSARVVGDLQQLLMLVKGLPLAYNRDLQEDKPPLFDAYDTVAASLELAAALVRETRFRKEVIAARLEDGFLDATTLMEYLIAQGVPMRSAHEAVGKLVRLCMSAAAGWPICRRKCMKRCAPAWVRGYTRCWVWPMRCNAFRSEGSTAPAEVAKQLDAWRRRLG